MGASILFIAFGVWLIVLSNQLNETGFSQIGSGYFPRLLAIALIILSVINLVKTFVTKDNKKIELPNAGRIWWTIGLLALFFVTWNLFGYFFIQVFVYLFIMFTLYRLPLGWEKKHFAINLAVALVLTLLIYLVFDVIMYVKF